MLFTDAMSSLESLLGLCAVFMLLGISLAGYIAVLYQCYILDPVVLGVCLAEFRYPIKYIILMKRLVSESCLIILYEY